MARCMLCDTDGANDRLCGCDVCATCRDGGLHDVYARWGLTARERSWTGAIRQRESDAIHHLEVSLRQPALLDARARFRQEGAVDRVLGWLWRSEPQVGDPLFDRFVYVGWASGADLARLLADPAIQSAVLEIVSIGRLRLAPGSLVAHCWSSEPLFSPQVAVPLALLAVRIEQIAGAV